jgi:hypothetical protein
MSRWDGGVGSQVNVKPEADNLHEAGTTDQSLRIGSRRLVSITSR